MAGDRGDRRNSGAKLFGAVIGGFLDQRRAASGPEKHRKGGNKSVATNMSLARLFIGHGVTLLRPARDIVFGEQPRDLLPLYPRGPEFCGGLIDS